MGSCRYSLSQRKKINARVRQLQMDGLTPKAIHQKLAEEEGIKNPDGSGPIKIGCIYDAINRKTRARYVPKPSALLPKTVASILDDSNLNDSQKIRMIKAYSEA